MFYRKVMVVFGIQIFAQTDPGTFAVADLTVLDNPPLFGALLLLGGYGNPREPIHLRLRNRTNEERLPGARDDEVQEGSVISDYSWRRRNLVEIRHARTCRHGEIRPCLETVLIDRNLRSVRVRDRRGGGSRHAGQIRAGCGREPRRRQHAPHVVNRRLAGKLRQMQLDEHLIRIIIGNKIKDAAAHQRVGKRLPLLRQEKHHRGAVGEREIHERPRLVI